MTFPPSSSPSSFLVPEDVIPGIAADGALCGERPGEEHADDSRHDGAAGRLPRRGQV